MRECVSVHVGQAGIQMGAACWELFCIEHRIQPDGTISPNSILTDDSLSVETFFHKLDDGRYTPRTIMADLEPTVTAEVQTSTYRHLFRSDQFIVGEEDAGSNYARGRYTLGREMIDMVLDRIRKAAEQCESPRGFLIFRSMGGGTGSGLAADIIERLSCEFSKKAKMEFAVYPTPHQSLSVVEPYNAVLSTHATLGHFGSSFLLDNEALNDICCRNLCLLHPTFANFNRLLAQVVSSTMIGSRSIGISHLDVWDYDIHNPYPRTAFPLLTYAPILNVENHHHQTPSVEAITYAGLDPTNQIVKCDTKQGKYMRCWMLYRGDVRCDDVEPVLTTLRRNQTIRFVDWCLQFIKYGLSVQTPMVTPRGDLAKMRRAVCTVASTTAIGEVFERLRQKFDLMYSRGAFVHWYIREGMELNEFHEAREDLTALIEDYKILNEEASVAE